jgi:hypothetical protein
VIELPSIFVSRTSELLCEDYGETIWEQCWWVNNVKWATGLVFLTIWWGPLYLLYRKNPDSITSAGSLIAIGWFLVGGFVSLIISFLLVEPVFLTLVGA